MSRSIFLWGLVALAVLALAGFSGWVFSLPHANMAASAPAIPQPEADAMLESLRPQRRGRPLIAVIGINDATETTDYLMPAGILRRADIADVVMLATSEGPVDLYPALKVMPEGTIESFDAAHPDGADYVIVPAMSRDDDPVVLAWLQDQARKGATVIGVCAGAKILAAAGLLDGKRATTHWYYLQDMLKLEPTVEYVANRRLVADGKVITTTGISASMPMTLTLIEAIAGIQKAEAVARDLGIPGWNLRHRSEAFQLTRPFAMRVLANRLAFWRSEELGIALQPGMDEVSLALVADAWSRTYRSRAYAVAPGSGPVESQNGLRIVPDRQGSPFPPLVSIYPERSPQEALDATLEKIAGRYDPATAYVVAMQLEYPSFLSD